MSGEPGVATGTTLSPEFCRRYFFERDDVSLGIVPQLLLGEREADLWSLFWYAARQVDDAIESGPSTGQAFAEALRESRASTPPEAAIQQFLREAQPYFEREPIRDGMLLALDALDREVRFRSPPSVDEYLRVVVAKAGFPLLVLNTLLLGGEPGSAIQRFSYLLAVSIQLGDDCRDIRRDQAHGIRLVCAEELEAARAAGLDPDSDDGFARIRAGRESVCKWLALRALEVAEKFVNKPTRDLARTEVLLWMYQIDQGQLREQNRPLKWPPSLAELLQRGSPTAPRLAAARILVRSNPALFGDPRRWDEKNRHAVLKLLAAEVPEPFRRALAPE